jgi:hypothetical protein
MGFKSSPGDIAGDATIKGDLTINTTTAGAVGAGFGDAASLDITIGKVNGEIITTILVDIEGLQESGVLKDIIGDNGETTGGAYITQITTAVNGIVYKAEIACVEEPAGGTADIDLVTNTNQLDENDAYDSGGGDAVALIPATAVWDTGMHRVSAAGLDTVDLVNAYLYLAAGAGDGSDSTYTAGKFIIKLYGASF